MIQIYHTPDLLNSLPGIHAGITYSNRQTINISGKISGLNLGNNTGVSESEIKQNFERLSDELQWKREQFALAEQVHGNKVKIISQPGFYENVDGFVTIVENIAIAIKVADCAAVLLADPSTHVIAAVHAGWRGAALDILPNTTNIMKELGADLEKTVAYVSPCISLQHFEVGEEVAEKFNPTFINRNIGAKPHLDLKSFLKKQLLDSGLRNKRIEIDPRCTIEDNRFYSYRRERENAGRMLAFIKYRFNQIH